MTKNLTVLCFLLLSALPGCGETTLSEKYADFTERCYDFLQDGNFYSRGLIPYSLGNERYYPDHEAGIQGKIGGKSLSTATCTVSNMDPLPANQIPSIVLAMVNAFNQVASQEIAGHDWSVGFPTDGALRETLRLENARELFIELQWLDRNVSFALRWIEPS
ncbi:MAG: hypothetical protein AAGD04_01525 [Pseudomonadota bacterium]